MNTQDQSEAFINSHNEAKRADMQALHRYILQLLPYSKLWFLDGKDDTGKVVTNPSIGYGQYSIRYKDGTTKEFYQIGISSNTAGISVYVMGLDDKKYLSDTFGTTIGKATVTGYCIRFKALKDIKMEVLGEAIRYGVEQTNKG